MTGSFQIRRSSKPSDKPGAVRFDIEHVSCERQSVFIVIDLSDSTRGITAQLESLEYLWRLLPSQWKVSLCALSPSLQLPGGEVTTSAGDVVRALEKMDFLHPANSKRTHELFARGSFLGPTLKAIDARRAEEHSSTTSQTLPAIIFVITDGELLDLGPVHPSADVKVIGLLTDTGNKRTVRWKAVVPRCDCFTASDAALAEHIRGIVSPDARKCILTLSLAPDEPPEVYPWDFAALGKYELDVPSYELSTEAFIECRSQSGASCKWPARSLIQGNTDDVLSGVADTTPATIASGALYEILDGSLIHVLRKHGAETHSEQCSWHADVIRLLATHMAKSFVDQIAHSTRPVALLAVFCRRDSGGTGGTPQDTSAEISRLLLCFLYEDRSRSIFIPQRTVTPSDPGFSAEEDVRLIYDNEQQRFALLAGDRPRRQLHLNECETLEYFRDEFGNKCTAFYSGSIEWPV